MNLVFVCTGNICRSPMAEGMFKKLLEEKGESGIDCSSAGLATFDGRPASDNAQAVALEYGVDISEHRSRMLTRSIARKADLIVCMTDEQYETLNRMIPDERLCVLAGGVDDPAAGALRKDKERELIGIFEVETVPMTEEYIGGVASLERECFSHPWSEKSLREELDNDQAHFLCAVADGFIAGYIGVQEIVGEAYITNVAVSEKFRRRGIAEKLLEEAERGAIKRGCMLITLEVRASNDPAKALYKKRGFKEVGTRKNFYSDPREDAEIMTKFFDR